MPNYKRFVRKLDEPRALQVDTSFGLRKAANFITKENPAVSFFEESDVVVICSREGGKPSVFGVTSKSHLGGNSALSVNSVKPLALKKTSKH
jgi:hypothetical protein